MSTKSSRSAGRNFHTSITAKLRKRFGIHPDLNHVDALIEAWDGLMREEVAWFRDHSGRRYRLRRPLPTEFRDDVDRKGLQVVERYFPTKKTRVWPLAFRFIKRPAKLDQETLADIWRTCHFIAELYGWEIEQHIKRRLTLPFTDAAADFEVEVVDSSGLCGWIDIDEEQTHAA